MLPRQNRLRFAVVPWVIRERFVTKRFGDPESMLTMTNRLFEAQLVIAALQGPFQFFLSTTAREVGYGWITNRRPAESIRLHHEMVLHVLEEGGSEFGVPSERLGWVLAGSGTELPIRSFQSGCP
jgi:hypothetical protein